MSEMVENVQSNTEKYNTYRILMGRYKRALNNEFYFEAMLIVYAVLTDRIRAFLFHIGAMRTETDRKLNVKKARPFLRALYFGSPENAVNKRLDIEKISVAINLIGDVVAWRKNCSDMPDEAYPQSLWKAFSKLKLDDVLKTLTNVKNWCDFRNEIIHGLMNKKVDSVNTQLRDKVEEGMKYAREFDKFVGILRKDEYIRKTNRIKA